MSGPTLPPRPPEPAKTKRGSGLAVVFVLLTIVTLAAALYTAPLGEFGRFIIIGSLIFAGVLSLHYFVWGWWLPKVIEKERRESER